MSAPRNYAKMRGEEMRKRAKQNILPNKANANAIPLLNIEGDNEYNTITGEYINETTDNNNLDNIMAHPIDRNNNSIDNANLVDENKSWTNWFTQKATPIKHSNDIIPITDAYKSRINAGKSKKNQKSRKNIKTTKKTKKIKKTRKLNKRCK